MGYRFKLIGYPIKHSLSPWIHRQFLDITSLQGTYTIHEIKPSDSFEESINQLKQEQIDGFNVTVPFKQQIIPFLDGLDDTARKIGAVNTVVHKNGKWIGYNTDGVGYLRSLESKYPDLFKDQTKRILVIGAGGAARAIYYSLIDAGFMTIDIANRTKSSAEKLVGAVNSSIDTDILSLEEAEMGIDKYDLIIQTTSVGMKPNTDQAILTIDKLKKETIVSDIVYQPLETKFLKQAKMNGGRLHFGHTMLLYQAQYAFEIWTNKQVIMDGMDNELQTVLEGR